MLPPRESAAPIGTNSPRRLSRKRTVQLAGAVTALLLIAGVAAHSMPASAARGGDTGPDAQAAASPGTENTHARGVERGRQKQTADKPKLSPEQAVQIVTQKLKEKGQVRSLEIEERGNAEVYKIVVTAGPRQRVLYIDPDSGKLVAKIER